MKTTKLFFASFILFLCFGVNTLWSQDRSDISGPQTETKNISKSEEVGSQVTNDNNQQQQNMTDEYGQFSVNGILGNLNNASNYANIPSNATFDESFDGSIEAWIFLSQGGTTQQIIGKGATANFQFLLGLNSANLLYFRIGNVATINTGGTAIATGVWTHVAVTWDGGGPYTIAFYVNGALSGATGNNAGTWAANSDPIKIGGPSGGFNSEVWNGQIDEVRFWSDTRTLAEIRDNRFVGLGDLTGANTSNALTTAAQYIGLDASWNFNNSGTVLDQIGGFNGTYNGSSTAIASIGNQPMAYNFALKCPGTGNNTSFVQVPNSSIFSQNGAGSLDAWIYLNSASGTQEICAKGNTSNNQFLWGVSTGVLYIRFGTSPSQNTGGVTLAANQWYHVATTWTGTAGNYSVRFYVNGVQSGNPVTNTGTWNITTDPFTIGGGIAFPTETFNGYIDEMRIWSNQLTADQVKGYMHNSSRAANMTGLVGAWNFDGQLLNSGTGTSVDGSFNTGGTNNCRISSFLNENTSGAFANTFDGYSTVVNRNTSPNPFIGGFAIRSPNKTIVDVVTTRDTIVLPTAGTTTSVELFLHTQHTFAGDLDIVLRAPNGQTRDICSDNGGTSASGILTFFIDGQTSVTSPTFFPPFSPFAGPEVAMGNMGSSPTNGAWILEITDDASGDTGVLLGWGIRLNGAVTAIEPVTNVIPQKFELYQNYPNPFNPVTKIKFDLPQSSNVRIAVYDILGREVKTLINEYTKAGQYEVPFDGSNIASGTYFFRIEAGDFTDVKKMILVK